MNWRRGLLRLWVVASVAWAIGMILGAVVVKTCAWVSRGFSRIE